ncbi:predicted protein [Histoplasma capsulatum G186AR]|uniref:Uncharacterized protein n=1 Tax=Ajellomyces capsulatus (strain G186AR / H82 / ATCC MYA-2454 / RMSCC 2432) TaxID=447093 RepID=C0NRG0_AJECG|nr:uncharacterized protein HCBG_05590 [Histoplasma capsulatum G186AR]EEH06274.1 predicted protein [Histoplasma capsulatum G186AR]
MAGIEEFLPKLGFPCRKLSSNKSNYSRKATGYRQACRENAITNAEIRRLHTVLGKGGYTHSPTQVQKREIDISSFTICKWPSVKFKLEIPRAELQRITTTLPLLRVRIIKSTPGAVARTGDRSLERNCPRAVGTELADKISTQLRANNSSFRLCSPPDHTPLDLGPSGYILFHPILPVLQATVQKRRWINKTKGMRNPDGVQFTATTFKVAAALFRPIILTVANSA